VAWVTVAAASAALGVSDDTVRRRIRLGELPAQVGEDGRILVDLPDDVRHLGAKRRRIRDVIGKEAPALRAALLPYTADPNTDGATEPYAGTADPNTDGATEPYAGTADPNTDGATEPYAGTADPNTDGATEPHTVLRLAAAQLMREVTAVREQLVEKEGRVAALEVESQQLRERLAEAEHQRDTRTKLGEQTERERDRLAQQLADAEQERRGVLALLQREQEEHARTRAQVAMLIPKLTESSDQQPIEQRRPWWRFW
jgi:hypothetical protein